MQYILSEEEYKALMPRKEYERIRNNLLKENEKLENVIDSLVEMIRDKVCADKGNKAYCDNCGLGITGLNLCTSNKKRYSK